MYTARAGTSMRFTPATRCMNSAASVVDGVAMNEQPKHIDWEHLEAPNSGDRNKVEI